MKAGWQIKKLADIADVKGGKRVPKGYKLQSDPTGYPYITVSDFTEDGSIDASNLRYISSEVFNQIKRYTISSQDLYLSIAGTIGKTGRVPHELDGANLTENACKLVLRPGVDRDFIYYFTKTDDFVRQAGTNTRVAAQPKLSLERLKTIRLPIPTSLPEQQRIVGILDEAFDGIAIAKANAEKNLQNARELLGVSYEAVASEPEQNSLLRTTVADVAVSRKGSIRTGPFGSQLLHSEFVGEGIAVLGIDNAVANEFRWGKNRFITLDKYKELERYRVYPGDVLITIMGTCGRCAIVPDDIPLAINTKHLCCITLDSNRCLPEYLHAYFLYHPTAQEFLSRKAKGAVMDGLNMGIIKELPLLLPSIQRQREVVEILGSLKRETQRLESIYEQKLAALDELKQSLLHKAFSGEL